MTFKMQKKTHDIEPKIKFSKIIIKNEEDKIIKTIKEGKNGN